jgi:hypothetical protein
LSLLEFSFVGVSEAVCNTVVPWFNSKDGNGRLWPMTTIGV